MREMVSRKFGGLRARLHRLTICAFLALVAAVVLAACSSDGRKGERTAAATSALNQQPLIIYDDPNQHEQFDLSEVDAQPVYNVPSGFELLVTSNGLPNNQFASSHGDWTYTCTTDYNSWYEWFISTDIGALSDPSIVGTGDAFSNYQGGNVLVSYVNISSSVPAIRYF